MIVSAHHETTSAEAKVTQAERLGTDRIIQMCDSAN